MIQRLCIIGTGLIGGSLARDLKRLGAVGEVVGSSRKVANLERALALGVIDDFDPDPAAAARKADMIVIAVPLGAIASVFERLCAGGGIDERAVITDVGSAKACVMEAAASTLSPDQSARFVPAHPIAGTEHSGVESSIEGLFERRRVILTPMERTSCEAQSRVRWMWERVGAEVIEMDLHRHDEVLALTSHLPHLLAYTLVDALGRHPDHAELFRYCAGGFYDFTRIASSDPQMWHDICLANKDAVVDALNLFRGDLDGLIDAVRQGRGETIRSVFARAKSIRDRHAESVSGQAPPSHPSQDASPSFEYASDRNAS
ncbi:prephenate dehydrogenase [Thioalkalivibrio sp. HK1]|uniref:prephenate dehydrogenase n=1 Tax=Thioalkalivibrio sp. HK1 TaxID=1469245 RepID=UPI0004709FD7|nr:prephenate dehydrogenase/arogenate dehydrogenase family protein [Thioalkalivibrio sp. HK1]